MEVIERCTVDDVEYALLCNQDEWNPHYEVVREGHTIFDSKWDTKWRERIKDSEDESIGDFMFQWFLADYGSAKVLRTIAEGRLEKVAYTGKPITGITAFEYCDDATYRIKVSYNDVEIVGGYLIPGTLHFKSRFYRAELKLATILLAGRYPVRLRAYIEDNGANQTLADFLDGKLTIERAQRVIHPMPTLIGSRKVS